MKRGTRGVQVDGGLVILNMQIEQDIRSLRFHTGSPACFFSEDIDNCILETERSELGMGDPAVGDIGLDSKSVLQVYERGPVNAAGSFVKILVGMTVKPDKWCEDSAQEP